MCSVLDEDHGRSAAVCKGSLRTPYSVTVKVVDKKEALSRAPLFPELKANKGLKPRDGERTGEAVAEVRNEETPRLPPRHPAGPAAVATSARLKVVSLALLPTRKLERPLSMEMSWG